MQRHFPLPNDQTTSRTIEGYRQTNVVTYVITRGVTWCVLQRVRMRKRMSTKPEAAAYRHVLLFVARGQMGTESHMRHVGSMHTCAHSHNTRYAHTTYRVATWRTWSDIQQCVSNSIQYAYVITGGLSLNRFMCTIIDKQRKTALLCQLHAEMLMCRCFTAYQKLCYSLCQTWQQ